MFVILYNYMNKTFISDGKTFYFYFLLFRNLYWEIILQRDMVLFISLGSCHIKKLLPI